MNAEIQQPRAARRWCRDALLVALIWALVYLPRLGVGGLTSTEGHRAIPGWQMLDSGQWMLPRLFGQVYLRKPPGMPWVIAVSSAVLGETELAARLPSALSMLGMSLTAMLFGARWFGRGGGLAAGMATALTPLFWSSGRSAEIEALNNFGACASVLLVLELLIGSARRAGALIPLVLLLTLSMSLTAMAKGPAGFAAIGSAMVIGLALGREPLGRRIARIAIPLVAAGLVVGLVAGAISRAVEASGQHAVMQGVSEFLWSGRPLSMSAIGQVAAMAPVALATALPASLALLFPWGADARAEAARSDEAGLIHRRAGALAWTCMLSLLMLTALGVHNPRYAMPSLSFVPVLVGYVWSGAGGAFAPHRMRIAHRMFLGGGWVWAAILLAGAAAYIGWLEPRQRATSGREAGRAVGALLPDNAMVWADHMIEARPEVLWYAAQTAAAEGKRIRPVWVPGMAAMLSLPRPGVYLLMRTDASSGEADAYRSAGFLDRLEVIWTGRIHKFECTLYRMHPLPARVPGG